MDEQKSWRETGQATGGETENISDLASDPRKTHFGKTGSKGRFPKGPTMFMEVMRHFYPLQPFFSPPDSIPLMRKTS